VDEHAHIFPLTGQLAVLLCKQMYEKQARQCAYNVILRSVRGTSYRRKALNITYSEYVVVALGIQRAKCMRGIIFICGLSGSTILSI
jgi:hypothetical protein